MPHAFIIGAGQIGRAVARDLLDRGWSVALASRSGGTTGDAAPVTLDRVEPGALARVFGDGADLLLDTVGFHAGHADQLLSVQGAAGRIVAVSSASVYADARGRTLDEALRNGFPDMPEPITEDQPTVEPGPATYSTRKVAMERRLLDGARVPAATLRPCAIHGPHSRHPREWWFVKRLLDGRLRIPLAYGGGSRFHTSAVANIAVLIAALVGSRATGPFNVADPDAPCVRRIGEAVMAALGREAELVPVPDPAYPPRLPNPWAVPRPFVVSPARAREVGYRPVGDYAATVAPAVYEIAAFKGVWRRAFPQLAAYPFALFDYTAEDRWLGEMVGADGFEPPTSSV